MQLLENRNIRRKLSGKHQIEIFPEAEGTDIIKGSVSEMITRLLSLRIFSCCKKHEFTGEDFCLCLDRSTNISCGHPELIYAFLSTSIRVAGILRVIKKRKKISMLERVEVLCGPGGNLAMLDILTQYVVSLTRDPHFDVVKDRSIYAEFPLLDFDISWTADQTTEYVRKKEYEFGKELLSIRNTLVSALS